MTQGESNFMQLLFDGLYAKLKNKMKNPRKKWKNIELTTKKETEFVYCIHNVNYIFFNVENKS